MTFPRVTTALEKLKYHLYSYMEAIHQQGTETDCRVVFDPADRVHAHYKTHTISET